MKILLFIFLIFLNFNYIDNIATINKIKKKAQQAFVSGNYNEAIKHYSYLIDSLKVNDENVLMNLAHAYYKLSVIDSAFNKYQQLSVSANKKLKSVANQQLGVIANNNNDKQAALKFFKEALKADHTNEDARYNYELLKKQLNRQQQPEDQKDKDQQDKKDQDKDQQNKQDNKKDQQQQNKENKQKDNKEQQRSEQQKGENNDQEKKDSEKSKEEKREDDKNEQENRKTKEQDNKEQLEKSQQMMDPQKLQEMKISPEKAKMILEAMRNTEIQYLQQIQKKPTKKRDSNKPDW